MTRAVVSNISNFIKQKDVLITATALVVGVAFQDVIRSLVKDIISPPIDAYMYGLANGEWTIKKPIDIDITNGKPRIEIDIGKATTPATTTSPATTTAAAAKTTTTPAPSAAKPDVINIRYGKFLQTVLAFVITVVVSVEFIKFLGKLLARAGVSSS